MVSLDTCFLVQPQGRAMLWNASGLNGFSIKASDGTLGGVTNFLFEDISWVIRCLVVDTGNWLADRKGPLADLGAGATQPSTA